MRSINDIQKTILDARQNVATMQPLEVLTPTESPDFLSANSSSKVATWRNWVWVFAFAQFVFEQFWEIFRKEIETRIAQSRIHTKKWYREKALAFLYGITLIPDTDTYDFSVITPEQIAASKIVSNAACVRVMQGGYGVLRMKVVQTLGSEYAPLTAEQLTALDVYFNNHVADAGTLVVVTSGEADRLKLVVDIYYDPMQLKADGSRLDGSDSTPVVTKINNYLKSIDFENGRLIISQMTDKLQQVSGVKIPVVKEAYSKYALYGYNAVGVANCGVINEIRIADAGYMKLDLVNSTFNYIAYND